jgi:hypothetical protein
MVIAPPVLQVELALQLPLALQVLVVQQQRLAYLKFPDLKGEGKPEFGLEPFPCFVQ